MLATGINAALILVGSLLGLLFRNHISAFPPYSITHWDCACWESEPPP